jgi:hypothetical protein
MCYRIQLVQRLISDILDEDLRYVVSEFNLQFFRGV